MTRVEKIQEKLKNQSLDGLLITSDYNLRYLTNFTGTSGLSLITQDHAFFVTDFRYRAQAQNQVKGFDIIEHQGSIYDELENLVQDQQVQKLGFEEDFVAYKTYQSLKDQLESDLVPISNWVEELREVKDESELALIQQAIKITEAAYDHILTTIKPGQTEIEVANELDFFMRNQGASKVSFDTIVASGARSAMPHGVASEKAIENGDVITIDFGCYYQGYVSDMTRTFALGDPGQELKDIYQIVLEANLKVGQAAKPGLTGKELDQVARDHIAAAGYGEYFGHGTGHGIGLEIHEGPTISPRNDQALVPGHVITNEPGIYLPNLGGVRIEDDLVITENGNRNLMTTTKELIIL